MEDFKNKIELRNEIENRPKVTKAMLDNEKRANIENAVKRANERARDYNEGETIENNNANSPSLRIESVLSEEKQPSALGKSNMSIMMKNPLLR